MSKRRIGRNRSMSCYQSRPCRTAPRHKGDIHHLYSRSTGQQEPMDSPPIRQLSTAQLGKGFGWRRRDNTSLPNMYGIGHHYRR